MNNDRKDTADSLQSPRGRAWVLELEFGLLLAVLLTIYCSRMAHPTIRGEESRRAQVAVEMIDSGDWIVPRLQGLLFLSRPPLQNWAIALLGIVRGGVDVVAVRLPSVLSTMLIACLIYGYARSFLSPTAALLAAAGYATMGQVLELGRLGETEALFTLFVSGSLLIWHWTDTSGWPKTATWILAYTLVALGTLTKGPQAPVYFVTTIGLYLLVSRKRFATAPSTSKDKHRTPPAIKQHKSLDDHRQRTVADKDRCTFLERLHDRSLVKAVQNHRWRELCSRPHLLGLLTFLLILSAWQIPFLYQIGWKATEHIYVRDVSFRFEDSRLATFVWHLFRFPAEVLLACLLPWSALLTTLLFPRFWKSLGPATDHAVFLVCCFVVTFPTCWLVPGAVGRYYMPLYPCIAVLVGLSAEQCWLSDHSHNWQKTWSRFLVVMAGLMLIVPASVFAISCVVETGLLDAEEALSKVAQPLSFVVAYCVVCGFLATATFRSRQALDKWQRRTGVLAVSAFLGMTYVGFYLNCLAISANDTKAQVAAVKMKIPPQTRLFSLGSSDHQFAFYFREPIAYQRWPNSIEELPADFSFFCFNPDQQPRPLPFAWEQIALVTCDRNRKKHSEHQVIVARRLPRTVAANRSRRARH